MHYYTTNQERNRKCRPSPTHVKLTEKLTGMDNQTLVQLAKNRDEW